MARTSRMLVLALVVVVGAASSVVAHVEATDGGAPATTPGSAAAGGGAPKKAAPAKPAPKSGAAKSGTAGKGGKSAAAKGGGGAKSAKTSTQAEAMSGPEVRNFQAFCDEWMQKLRDRETYNTSHVAWETHDGRVSGEYVGYDTKCTCIAREEPGKDPIGKITYRETRYRREGASESAALAAPGTVLEQSDVTEIFRFGKGRWQY